MEKRVFEAYIFGKRSRGRPRYRWDRTVKEAFGSFGKATRVVKNKRSYHAAIREAKL